MQSTVLELVTRSLRMIDQLGPGRLPNASETADAILALNGMLDQANTDPLKRYTTRIDAYPLDGAYRYTLGPGGDFDATRPVRIVRANRILTSTSPVVRTPIQVLDDEEWSQIRVQQVPSANIPLKIYPDGSYPLINLYVWPGSSAEYQLELYTWQQLGQFNSQENVVDCPPGYFDWMSYGLAERLALEWGKQLRPEVAMQAAKARAAIKAGNTRAPNLQTDVPNMWSGGHSVFNYRTGD